MLLRDRSWLPSVLDGVLPLVLVLLPTLSIPSGMSDLLRFVPHVANDSHSRRMMMTSGSGVNYKSMFDAGSQIVAKEGTKSLFKGAGANILRGVAGAGVLSLYDKLQEVMFGKVYSGGKQHSVPCRDYLFNAYYFQDLVKKRLIDDFWLMLEEFLGHPLYTFITHRPSFFLSFIGYGYTRRYPSHCRISVERSKSIMCFCWHRLDFVNVVGIDESTLNQYILRFV